MLRISYNKCCSAIGVYNEDSTIPFVKVGVLHSNQFFSYYIGEDNLIYEVIPNGNSRSFFVEEGITRKELDEKVESLKLIPVKRLVLKLLGSPSNSNDFFHKNLVIIEGVIVDDVKRIGDILADQNSDANKALTHIKMSAKETGRGFVLTDWGYYGYVSSNQSIKLLIKDGQEYLTCPE